MPWDIVARLTLVPVRRWDARGRAAGCQRMPLSQMQRFVTWALEVQPPRAASWTHAQREGDEQVPETATQAICGGSWIAGPPISITHTSPAAPGQAQPADTPSPPPVPAPPDAAFEHHPAGQGSPIRHGRVFGYQAHCGASAARQLAASRCKAQLSPVITGLDAPLPMEAAPPHAASKPRPVRMTRFTANFPWNDSPSAGGGKERGYFRVDGPATP